MKTINKILQKIIRKYAKISNKVKHKYYKNCKFEKGASINEKTVLEGSNYIGFHSVMINSFMGVGSYISNNSKIKYTKIGRFCAIGDNVQFSLGNHPTTKFVSISPVFYSKSNRQIKLRFSDAEYYNEHTFIDEKYTIIIGNDVWIGNDVKILDGVKIANGVIIGSGSIVTKSIDEPYSIYTGMPAKLKKFRFNQPAIEKLLKLKWWEKDINWLHSNYKLFHNVDHFIKMFDKPDFGS